MRWGRRARRAPDLAVVSRQGCHLCEEMVEVVRQTLPRTPLRVLDLDLAHAAGEVDDILKSRWTTLVPVLLLDGEEVAHYRVDPQTLRRLVREEGPGRRL